MYLKSFYSGMGLTTDHDTSNNFKTNIDVSIEQLVFALLTKYQVYLDPRTKSFVRLKI